NNGANVVGNQGGGLFLRAGASTTLVIANSTLSTNTAYLGGGAYLWVENGKSLAFTMQKSIVTANKATFSGGTTMAGVGLVLDAGSSSTTNVDNCTFTSNVSSRMGGGLTFSGTPASAEANVTRSTFTSNSGDRGSGLYLNLSSPGVLKLRVSRSSFWKNGG